MDSEKLSSEKNEDTEAGLPSLDFLFEIADLSEGLDILAKRLVSFSEIMDREITALEGIRKENIDYIPLMVNYLSAIPPAYVADVSEYSVSCRELAVLPDFMDFAEIVAGGDYFFI